MAEDICDEKGPPGHPIVDELLCFITNKLGLMNSDTIVKLCVENFDDKEIEASKDILFGLLCDENAQTALIKRRRGKVNESKSVKNMHDMLQLLQEKGGEPMPQFVALDLSRLPPISFNDMDVTVLLNKIQNVDMAVKLLKKGMAEMSDTNKSLHELNLSQEDRIRDLEAKAPDINVGKSLQNFKNMHIGDCEEVIDKQIEKMPFACSKCDIRFELLTELNAHQQKSHMIENPKIAYTCMECDKIFESSEELFDHNCVLRQGTHICLICGHNSASEAENQTHMIFHMEKITCKKCNKSFASNEELTSHECHHKPYACTKCEYKTASQNDHTIHMLNHTKDVIPFACYVCEQKYTTITELKSHMITHTEAKNYVCSECDLICRDLDTLKQHRKVHEKPIEDNVHLCCFCEKNCASLEDLRMHLFVHTGEKLYKCSECDFECMKFDILSQHKELHIAGKLGVGTYVCSVCDIKCNTSLMLNQHMSIHKKPEGRPNSCTECDYKCKDLNLLNKHMNVHTGEKPTGNNKSQFPLSGSKSKGRHNSTSSTEGGAWNFNEFARQQLIANLINNDDGFSMPFKNGKPISIKDILKANSASPHTGPEKNSRYNNKGMIGKGRDSDLSIQNRKFRAVIFASRYKPQTDANAVKRELETDLLRLTGTKHTVSVEKLAAKFDHYASFKVTCFCDNKSVFLNEDLWPPGIYFRWWIKPKYGSELRDN